jgi:hypothetical protein
MSNLAEKVAQWGPVDREKGQFRTIQQDMPYDEDVFGYNLDYLYGDVEKPWKKLADPNKSAGDLQYNLGKLSRKLYPGDPTRLFKEKDPLIAADLAGREAVHEAKNNAALYVKKHFDKFLNKVDGQALMNVLFAGPLIKDGSDDEYEDVRLGIQEMGKLQQAGQSVDGMSSYIQGKMKNSDDWVKSVWNTLGQTSEHIQGAFSSYSSRAQNRFGSLLSNAEGKVDKGKVEKILKHNLDELWKIYHNAKDDGDKGDILESSIRDFYLSIADIVKKKMVEDYEKHKNPGKKRDEKNWEDRGVKW